MKKAKQMAPSNMSIQTGSERPSMKQDDHPDHNMPEPEHNGIVINPHGRGASTSDAAQRGSKRTPLEEAMPYNPPGDLDHY